MIDKNILCLTILFKSKNKGYKFESESRKSSIKLDFEITVEKVLLEIRITQEPGVQGETRK